MSIPNKKAKGKLEVLDSIFKKGLIYNFSSFALIALIGLSLNIIIIRYYGLSGFGTFSLAFSIFFVMGALSVGGVHYSVLKYLSEQASMQYNTNDVLAGAIQLCFCIAFSVVVAASIVLIVIRLFIPAHLSLSCMIYILPAILIFSLNKVYLTAFNGLRNMKIYAASQLLRFIVLLSSVLCFIFIKLTAIYLPLSFTISECFLLIFNISIFRVKYGPLVLKAHNEWFFKHWRFSKHAFFSSFLLDINPRIDVLILAMFTSIQNVGIYSFVAMIIEGLSQIPLLIQANLAPVLTRLWLENNHEGITSLVNKSLKVILSGMFAVGLFVYYIYPIIFGLFVGQSVLSDGRNLFVILIVGYGISAVYVPFSMLLSQAGRPDLYSFYLLTIAVVNIVLNFILTPWFGMYGAAISTMLSCFSGVFMLKRLSWSNLEVRI